MLLCPRDSDYEMLNKAVFHDRDLPRWLDYIQEEIPWNRRIDKRFQFALNSG